MSLWHKLSIDWPARFGDRLYDICVVEAAKRLETLTFRRVFYLSVLIVAAVALAQIVSFDVALLFAGDVAFYLEALTIITLVAARGHVLHAVRIAAGFAGHAVRRIGRAVPRFRARQRRSAAPIRSAPKKNEDDWPAVAWAF